ncbi:MAG: hypothetical protein H0W73_09170 [Bacteroidetes bacterium]|nr:hypothetical protein [Bacteroidota bacterium]
MKKTLFFVLFTLAFYANTNAQDKIKLKTGAIVKARVLKVSGTEITYYKIFKLKDPKLKMPKSDVDYIQYENGKIVYMGKNIAKKGTAANPTKKTTTKKTTTKKK